MKVPNRRSAIVPPQKISAYLLDLDHPDGGSKANFFLQFGFDFQTLTEALLSHVVENEVFSTEETEYGRKFVVFGKMESPSGLSFNLKSVWIVRKGEARPSLLTAFPSKK